MIVSAPLLGELSQSREQWAVKRAVGWPLVTVEALKGGGIQKDPVDAENQSG